jgi:hypothetical protein
MAGNPTIQTMNRVTPRRAATRMRILLMVGSVIQRGESLDKANKKTSSYVNIE